MRYEANGKFDGPSSIYAGPCWCFSRFGRSQTTLPDGRIAYIGGEHEDCYDPDFYIYNDIVIIDTQGDVQIFGYPTGIFPPTDFHSATLVDNAVILIGNLGYPDDRRHHQTQVLRLEIDSWRVFPVETFGEAPGWIYEHHAELMPNGNEIRITGGKVCRDKETPGIENIDEWCLDLQTWHWKRLTRRHWVRFTLCREDKQWNHLWEVRNLLSAKQLAERHKKFEKNYKKNRKEFEKRFGILPDQKLHETLYRPDIATEIVTTDGIDDDEYGIYRIRIDGVIVRYVENMYGIEVIIEGELPQDIVEQLKNDIMEKFTALERTPIICQEVI